MQLVRCPRCEKANRVPPNARGTPRCGSCHEPLPWLVAAPLPRLQGWLNSQLTLAGGADQAR